MKLPTCIFKHHTIKSYWGLDIKLKEFLTTTLGRASVPFHSPESLISRKEALKITKEGVEIWCGGIS
jgi:hypothetical protein